MKKASPEGLAGAELIDELPLNENEPPLGGSEIESNGIALKRVGSDLLSSTSLSVGNGPYTVQR